jgi:hypothetical protein
MSEKDAKKGINADRDKFRAELIKAMPGYQWTVRKRHSADSDYCEAEGIQSSGFNRLSTLQVIRTEPDGEVWYVAKSAGYGTKAPWLFSYEDNTLLRALRGLQNRYASAVQEYAAARDALIRGRTGDPS